MIEDGTIAEDERVELIEGLLVAKSRRNRPCIVAGNKGLRILWRMIPPGWHVAKSVPIQASDWSRPEADLAIIRGVIEDYDEREPTADDTALVVEIVEAALSADRSDMAECTRPRVSRCTGSSIWPRVRSRSSRIRGGMATNRTRSSGAAKTFRWSSPGSKRPGSRSPTCCRYPSPSAPRCGRAVNPRISNPVNVALPLPNLSASMPIR